MKNLWLRLCSSTIGSLFLFLLVPYLLLFWLEYKEEGGLSPSFLCTYGTLFVFCAFCLLFSRLGDAPPPQSQTAWGRFCRRWKQAWQRRFPLYGFLILLAVFTFRDWGTGQLEWDFWVDPLICIAAFAFFSRQQS